MSNIKSPYTAVAEGLSDALASIAFNREEADLPELNLTDEERLRIEANITEYVSRRFTLVFKESP